jgi:hypothetical protein
MKALLPTSFRISFFLELSNLMSSGLGGFFQIFRASFGDCANHAAAQGLQESLPALAAEHLVQTHLVQ